MARGDVERAPDPADRRSWSISLTVAGRARVDRLVERVVAERELVFAGFGEDELAAVAVALERIDANVRRLLATPGLRLAPAP